MADENVEVSRLLEAVKSRTPCTRWGIGCAGHYLDRAAAEGFGPIDEAARKDADGKLCWSEPKAMVRRVVRSVLRDDRERLARRIELVPLADKALGDTEVPGACCVFDAVLTTRDEDRDGDVLEPGGAEIDPHGPLLFNHVTTQPIGRLIAFKQNKQRVQVREAILDFPFGRDVAALIEFGALRRMSHGFLPKPGKFEEREQKDEDDPGGWHIREYEVMERSVVSVASNRGALIESWNLLGAKSFCDPAVRRWAKGIYDSRPKVVQVRMPAAPPDPSAKPYANEHAARLRDPDDFARIRQLWRREEEGIRCLGGPLKSKPEGDAVEQAIRFDAGKWSPAEAKAWLKKHDYKPIAFEPATGADAAGAVASKEEAAAAVLPACGAPACGDGVPDVKEGAIMALEDEAQKSAATDGGQDAGAAGQAVPVTRVIPEHKEVPVMADEQVKVGDMADAVATKVAGAVAEQMAPLAAAINKLAEAVTPKAAPEAKPEAAPETKPEPKVDFSGPAAKEWIARQVSLIMAEKALPETKLDMNAVILGPLAGTKGGDVRVKDPTERYSDVKTALCYPAEINGRPTWHPRAGMPVASFDGRQYNMPTERTKALAGAFLRWQLYTAAYGQQGAWSRMSEHFRDLVHHLLRDCTWTGCLGGWEGEEITRQRLGEKATVIINDVTSGGSYAAPDVFEEAVMVAPNLFGELFPLVTLINLPRGASVDGFTWTDPSWTSGYTEGTSATCVTTDSIIGNLDTTIFGAVCPIKMGLDWESDSPVNWGAFIVDRIGQRLQVWLDEQIAVGDGTTEPEGIFTKSGVTSVSSDNGTDGPFTMGDLESLAWGLGKAYRTESPCVYVTSDTVYRRARAVPTANSGTVYETRALGMDHSSYKILEWPCKVQNSITTGSIAFWAPKYYRLYRRLGMQVRSVTEGQTLALENTRLLVFRARFGGKVGIAASVAKMTDGPQTG